MSAFNSPNPALDRLKVKHIVQHVAETNAAITYGKLADLVGAELGWRPGGGAQSFAYSLGRIQEYCQTLGLPCLTVMAVGSTTYKPKVDGFIPCYRSLHPEADRLADDEIILRETQNVLACRNWQVLYDFVGLAEQVPAIRNRLGETEAEPILLEGARIQKDIATEVKRNAKARAQCLARKGYRCVVCEKTSEEIYGIAGIIHVHHLKPLVEATGERKVDYLKDLVPVCPMCHAVIHSRQRPCYSIDEVREMLGKPPLGKTTS